MRDWKNQNKIIQDIFYCIFVFINNFILLFITSHGCYFILICRTNKVITWFFIAVYSQSQLTKFNIKIINKGEVGGGTGIAWMQKIKWTHMLAKFITLNNWTRKIKVWRDFFLSSIRKIFYQYISILVPCPFSKRKKYIFYHRYKFYIFFGHLSWSYHSNLAWLSLPSPSHDPTWPLK